MVKAKLKLTSRELAELDGLLDPTAVVHEAGRKGTAALLASRPSVKALVVETLFLRGGEVSIDSLVDALPKAVSAGMEREALVAALRRLLLVGAPFGKKVREARAAANASKDIDEKAAVTLSLKPGTTLADHIKNAKIAPRDLDCVAKMAGVATLLEQQLDSLYNYPTREAQPFMGVKHINMVAQSYIGALDRLHRMQMDVGLVEKQPEKMEVSMQHAGVFQTYVGELSSEHKDKMAEFADRFCALAEERLKARGDD